MSTKIEPILKWVGSKRWLVSKLQYYYDKNKRLVDPFVGSMSVPLFLLPSKALISDINPHLMNLYKWVQQGLVLDKTCGIEFIYDKKIYYKNRSKFNELCNGNLYQTKEGALLFYYLNRTCFNGLCRFNKNGEFNAAFGKFKEVKFIYDFSQYKNVINNWELCNRDFEDLPILSDDWIYSDPPYDMTFNKFTDKEFTWKDQERLMAWLYKHPGPVISSNSNTERMLNLYRKYDFKIYTVSAPRLISCDGNRTPVTEIIAFRNI